MMISLSRRRVLIHFVKQPEEEEEHTCAIEADASGVGSTYSYTLSMGLPSSSCKILRISSNGTGGALSKQF